MGEGIMATADEANVGTCNDMAHYPDIIPLADIRVPTMATHGTCDGDVPIEQAKTAVATIPIAVLNEIEGASHLICFHEKGREAMETQISFIRKHLN